MSNVFIITLLSAFLSLTQIALALEVPALEGPVMDQVGLLTQEEQLELEHQIVRQHQLGLAQGQILIIKSLESEVLEDYSIRVVDKWKLGDEKKDNGWLILVSYNDRAIRIEVGQGLEGDLTDIQSQRIIDVMKDYFREKAFYDGLYFAVKKIEKIIASNDQSSEGQGRDVITPHVRISQDAVGEIIFFILLIILVVLLVVLRMFRNIFGFPSSNFPNSYRSGHGGWGQSSSNSGSWGGFGGGWGGGGGGFSGGGSSGKW